MQKSKYKSRMIFLIGVSTLFLGGCAIEEPISPDQISVTEDSVSINELPENIPLIDNDALYVDDVDDSVVTMYLTVSRGNKAENTDHSWKEVNGHSVYYYDNLGIERYQVEGLLQVGDENGPQIGQLGYDEKIPNATVTIRGQTSSAAEVKSYKIELKDMKGSFKEQQTINLNKHIYDGLRFRNKLSYDLMEEMPGMISLRTQFVHLYVKDLTDTAENEFVDYGLFTQVEQPNKTFLKNHGFDRYGQLYKIEFFEFFRYEDSIKLKSDVDYDQGKFEQYLEIKGDDDHSKLIQMLDELNNDQIPIEEIVPKWFDEENLLSWMAFHILVGNKDTQSRNTLLYSPQNLNKWYFISWDNDDALRTLEKSISSTKPLDGWDYGICNYWGNLLFQRLLKSEAYRDKLDSKIIEFKDILTKDKIAAKVGKYRPIAWKYRHQLPDIMHNRLTDEEFNEVCDKLPDEIEYNYQKYKESLKDPMPFYIGVPSFHDGKVRFVWDNSVTLDREEVRYQFELSRDLNFSEIIARGENLILPEYETQELLPGQYFVKITSEDESGDTQYAFDYYITDEGNHYGILCFYVLEDGSIEVNGNVEN